MFELKQSLCCPGYGVRANEDAIGYGRNYCFVMDGASGLSGKNVVDSVSDAAWMVKMVRKGLCRLLDAEDPRPTHALLEQVVAQVRQEYVHALENSGMDVPQDSPSAGFALFRKREGRLEFFGLGDCVGVAELSSGENFAWLDHNLPVLDNRVLEQMEKLCQNTGVSMAAARKQCSDLLLHNRSLRNKPGGYWVLDLLTDDGICNAHRESWELTEPIRVGAFSDGFAQLAEVFDVYPDYSALFEAMQKTDLQAMFRQLCALQDKDPDCNDHPRFKRRDDTCALWGIFHPDM